MHLFINMQAAVVFTIAFLVLLGVTLLVPSFPPAQILLEYLKIQQYPFYILGLSAASILNGILNGFFWVLIGAAIYGAASYAKRRNPLPPMPEAPVLSTPPPEPVLVDSRTNIIPPSLTVSEFMEKEQYRKELDIETIDGIGPICGGLLRNSGVNTVNDLLKVCATERGRKHLANEIGVPQSMLLQWVYRGDLLRVKGVGKKYAALLESAGVNTVSDLSTRNPRYLFQKLKAVNKEKRIVKRTPPSKTIEIWVDIAGTLEPIIKA
jgi:predicted flap endonuclease-1-like 5' DNA nuclease